MSDRLESDLAEQLDEVRQARDERLGIAQAEFAEEEQRAEYAYREALRPIAPLEAQITELAGRIERLRGEAKIARDSALGPARRIHRDARVAIGEEYDEECAWIRREHELSLQDARSDMHLSDWRLEEIEGGGECLIWRSAGTFCGDRGEKQVDHVMTLGLVTERFVQSLGHKLEDPMFGVDWWVWTTSAKTKRPYGFGFVALSRLLSGDYFYHQIPQEYAEWIERRTLDAVTSGEAHEALLSDTVVLDPRTGAPVE